MRARSGIGVGVIIGAIAGAGCLGIFVLAGVAFLVLARRPGSTYVPAPISRPTWSYTTVRKGNDTILDSDGVTLIYEGVRLDSPTSGGFRVVDFDGRFAGRATGWSGSGAVWTTFRSGMAVIRVQDQQVMIRDGGAVLVVGVRQFDLLGQKKTIVIHRGGVAEIYDPTNVPPLSTEDARKRLTALLRSGRHLKAELEVEGFLRQHPDDVHLLFFKGVCLRGRNAREEADSVFQELQAASPSSLEGRCADCIVKLDATEYPDKNLAALSKITAEFPRDPLPIWMLAVECNDYKKTAEGLKACEKLLAVTSPGSPYAQKLYADLLVGSSKVTDALPHRMLAAKFEPAKWSFEQLAETLDACHFKYAAQTARTHADATYPEPMSTPAEMAFSKSERHAIFRENDRLTLQILKAHKNGFDQKDLEKVPQFYEFMSRRHVDSEQLMEINSEGSANRWDLH